MMYLGGCRGLDRAGVALLGGGMGGARRAPAVASQRGGAELCREPNSGMQRQKRAEAMPPEGSAKRHI